MARLLYSWVIRSNPDRSGRKNCYHVFALYTHHAALARLLDDEVVGDEANSVITPNVVTVFDWNRHSRIDYLIAVESSPSIAILLPYSRMERWLLIGERLGLAPRTVPRRQALQAGGSVSRSGECILGRLRSLLPKPLCARRRRQLQRSFSRASAPAPTSMRTSRGRVRK